MGERERETFGIWFIIVVAISYGNKRCRGIGVHGIFTLLSALSVCTGPK